MNKIDLSSVKNGIVCFTFDDRNFEGWINALPLFEKYNAHATFFISGVIDENAIKTISALKQKGHTVGLHTFSHADAPPYFNSMGADEYFNNEIAPQLEVCKQNGLEIKSFAYPNNLRNDETDKFLSNWFSRFRAGCRDAKEEQIYLPLDKLSDNRAMRGIGIGKYYNTVETELLEKIEYVAKTNTCVTFFSHNIAPNADFINMPTELLEKCLEKANELGVLLLGFDEL